MGRKKQTPERGLSGVRFKVCRFMHYGVGGFSFPSSLELERPQQNCADKQKGSTERQNIQSQGKVHRGLPSLAD
jgi:hypothetical protein